eukprot:6190197-Pleurochrysis_carterae.AAC.2
MQGRKRLLRMLAPLLSMMPGNTLAYVTSKSAWMSHRHAVTRRASSPLAEAIEDFGKVDLWALIGCSDKATQPELQAAYRKKARELHPDLNGAPDARENFMRLTKAMEVLSDPKRRAQWEQQRELSSLDFLAPTVYGSQQSSSLLAGERVRKRAVRAAERADRAEAQRQLWEKRQHRRASQRRRAANES